MKLNEQDSFFKGLAGISKLFIFILILVIVAGIFIVLTENKEPAKNETEINSEESSDTISENQADTETVNEEYFSIPNQEAGSSVFISELVLNENRWVVIHEDLNGELGSILGAGLFTKEADEGKVDLLRDTEEGKQYQAVLYRLAEREKDKDRIFDSNRDLPLTNDNDELLSTSFETY
jgi:hypothetical protein